MDVLPQHWGIWVDGRDVHKGLDGYGSDYSHKTAKALQGIIDTTLHHKLNVDIFEKIKHLLKREWRDYPNPVMSEVKACHDTLPKKRVSTIMREIIVTDDNYGPKIVTNFTQTVEALFTMYNKYIAKAGGDHPHLYVSVGWLMQNLAFLHPLGDGNGRSRLLLLQYELRRLGLACGTMMHNNNKNIYFDSLSTFVEKIREGVEAYNTAFDHKFRSNPWCSKHLMEKHELRFHEKSYSAHLDKCWKSWCGSTNPGCQGTSPFVQTGDVNFREAAGGKAEGNESWPVSMGCGVLANQIFH